MTFKSLIKIIISACFFLLSAIGAEAQIGRLPLSPLQTIEQNIARTDITISYSRPSMKGRKIFGDLVPYNQYWRTGANKSTTIEFSEDVSIRGMRVPKGKYAIFTIPMEEEWDFLLYNEIDNFDVPLPLDEEKIVIRTYAIPKMVDRTYENFTIGIDNFDNYKFDLVITWEQTQIRVPVDLTTREMMDQIISEELAGPDYGDYYLAATYEFESGKDYARGLTWINKAIEISEEVNWWDYRIKAFLLSELGKNNEALSLARKGLDMAKEHGSEFGVREFKKLINRHTFLLKD